MAEQGDVVTEEGIPVNYDRVTVWRLAWPTPTNNFRLFSLLLGFSFTCLFLFILFAKFDAAILSCLRTPHSIHTPKWALVRTQTLYKLCDMFHSINCESQFEFSFQSDNWILQHIQSIVLLSISGRVFVVVHSSSSVYTMQDWESNHLWFPRAKKPNIWVGVSLAAAAYLPCCSDTMGTNSIDFCIINIQRGRNQQAVVFIICSTISRSRQPWHRGSSTQTGATLQLNV